MATAADVALGLRAVDQGAAFTLPAPALEILRSDERDTIFFCIRDVRRQPITGDCDLPEWPTAPVPPSFPKRVFDIGGPPLPRRSSPSVFRGTAVHAMTMPVDVDGHAYSVTVAETDRKRSAMLRTILVGMAIPVVIVLGLSA